MIKGNTFSAKVCCVYFMFSSCFSLAGVDTQWLALLLLALFLLVYVSCSYSFWLSEFVQLRFVGAAQPHDWQGEVGPGTLTSNPSGDCGCELFTVPTPGASPSLFITLKNTSAFLQSKKSALLTASVIAHGGSMPLSNRYSITLKTSATPSSWVTKNGTKSSNCGASDAGNRNLFSTHPLKRIGVWFTALPSSVPGPRI